MNNTNKAAVLLPTMQPRSLFSNLNQLGLKSYNLKWKTSLDKIKYLWEKSQVIVLKTMCSFKSLINQKGPTLPKTPTCLSNLPIPERKQFMIKMAWVNFWMCPCQKGRKLFLRAQQVEITTCLEIILPHLPWNFVWMCQETSAISSHQMMTAIEAAIYKYRNSKLKLWPEYLAKKQVAAIFCLK